MLRRIRLLHFRMLKNYKMNRKYLSNGREEYSEAHFPVFDDLIGNWGLLGKMCTVDRRLNYGEKLVHKLEELYQLARMPVDDLTASVAFSDKQIDAIKELYHWCEKYRLV